MKPKRKFLERTGSKYTLHQLFSADKPVSPPDPWPVSHDDNEWKTMKDINELNAFDPLNRKP